MYTKEFEKYVDDQYNYYKALHDDIMMQKIKKQMKTKHKPVFYNNEDHITGIGNFKT